MFTNDRNFDEQVMDLHNRLNLIAYDTNQKMVRTGDTKIQ
eukprot:COSAG01_NODE_68160_length_265_cov_0.536145_1_plen_39_part_01